MRTRPKKNPEESQVVALVSSNVRRLMNVMEWSEQDLSDRSGVSQKAINNLLNKRTGCTITTANKLARPFGLTGWQLMLEDISADEALGSTLTQVVSKIIKSDTEARAFILSAVDRA